IVSILPASSASPSPILAATHTCFIMLGALSTDSNQKRLTGIQMDIIFIHELRIDTLIGIYEWEQQTPQTIQLDLEVGLPGEHAAHSGKLGDTIDYSKIVGRIEQLFKRKHHSLWGQAGGRMS